MFLGQHCVDRFNSQGDINVLVLIRYNFVIITISIVILIHKDLYGGKCRKLYFLY